MSAELIHLGITVSSLILLVVIPFLPVAYLLFQGQQWPKILFSAMVLGCCIQATIGLLWSHLAVRWPAAEAALLFVVWLSILGLVVWRRGKREVLIWEDAIEPKHLGLILILGAGFIIRSIHPVEVAYLGQSDAYTHLNYVHNIVGYGHLSNPVYTPGYHWILALPSIILSIDPYATARFAGAFFGTGLVLGVYVLLDQCLGRRTALFGSFCASAFPGMTLLMKTGVGAFANQFGLMLLPGIFLYYIVCIANEDLKSKDRFLLIISLCGLVAAVPMMLFHVLLIFSCERVVRLFRNRRQWLRTTARAALLLLPAICLLSFHLAQVGGGQRSRTAEMMTDYSDNKITDIGNLSKQVEKKLITTNSQSGKFFAFVLQSPYFTLLTDYLSIKRKGFGNLKLDLVAGILALLFFSLLLVGVVRMTSAYILIGCWGMITSLQAGTGFLQFSSYQREGWSLLIATCCLSGIIASAVYDFGVRSHKRIFQFGVITAMVLFTAWSVVHPPFHVPIRSGGEGELIRAVRFLGKYQENSINYCNNKEENNSLCSIIELLNNDLETVLVTRRYVGWGNQGEIAPNVIPPNSKMEILVFRNKTNDNVFQPGRQYVVLVDGTKELRGKEIISAFAMVTPSMVEATLKDRGKLLKLNDKLIQRIENLSTSAWSVDSVSISDNLSAYVVRPSN
jgi:hypothetical protein